MITHSLDVGISLEVKNRTAVTGGLFFLRELNIELYGGDIIMKPMPENLEWYYDGDDKDKPIRIFVRDREARDKIRWCVASLSSEEAKGLCEFLQEALK